MLIDFGERRKASLQRCNSQIEEMKQVLDRMPSDSPQRYLAEALIARLRLKAARLSRNGEAQAAE